MPINFDWRNLQQYAMPALGIVSLLVSAIIVIVSGVGDEYVKSSSQGPSSDNDANVPSRRPTWGTTLLPCPINRFPTRPQSQVHLTHRILRCKSRPGHNRHRRFRLQHIRKRHPNRAGIRRRPGIRRCTAESSNS